MMLSPEQRAILEVLDVLAPLATKDITVNANVWLGPTRAKASARCRAVLLNMKALGWVVLLDNEQPHAWVRTPAGTAMLAKTGAS